MPVKTVKKHTLESTLHKLRTVFENELIMMGGAYTVGSGVRQRVMELNYQVLREMAKKLSPVSMVINCREQQCLPFYNETFEVGQPGFVINKKGERDKRFKKKDPRAKELVQMFQNTGYLPDPLREDDFIDYSKMMLREILTIDQVAVELQRNRRGEVSAFWILDGATISRCVQKGYKDDPNIAYVQEIDNQVTATYTRSDLVMDCMFKRVDMRYRGYGYSLLEQAVDLITTLILGISYNRDSFTKDKIPKGFIALQGEADRETIEAIERYWYMAMSGAGARFTIPILPTGKEGVSMDFKMLNQTNKEMEYRELMMFFLGLFGAVYGIDLAELGLKTDNTQQVLGESTSNRQKFSKDRALSALLSWQSGFNNKILNKIDSEYEFSFVGLDPEDEIRKYEIQTKAIGATRSINEMREEDGIEPKEGPEYDEVLNTTLVQVKSMLQQKAQQQSQSQEGNDFENEEEMSGEEGDDLAGQFDDGSEDFEKSIQDHIDTLTKAGYDLEIEL